MLNYRIWPKDGSMGEEYWLQADSPEQARRLVAESVDNAGDVKNPDVFGCTEDNEKIPPRDHLIYRRLSGPVKIAGR